jgi:iron(III) transport system substrate-binding protein
VFWSSEVFFTVRLAREGLLATHVSETTNAWPARLTGPEHRWHGMAQRARVVVHNTKAIDKNDAPRNMHDLLDVRFQDRIVMARPQFGTTRGHMAALAALWGEEAFRDWLVRLEVNGVRLLDGNSAVVRAVATGEADVGLTDTDDVWAGQRNGWPVDMVYVRHDLASRGVSEGPMMIPNAVSIIAGGPHPEEAALLADYLLSERLERMLAESESRNVPVRDALAAEFPALAVPDPMTVGFETITDHMELAVRLCEELLGR